MRSATVSHGNASLLLLLERTPFDVNVATNASQAGEDDLVGSGTSRNGDDDDMKLISIDVERQKVECDCNNGVCTVAVAVARRDEGDWCMCVWVGCLIDEIREREQKTKF